MASEEIKLIGSFKDDITPQLKKLNKQIETVGRSFGKFSRNLRPIAKEFGRMAMASRSFNDELRQQAKLMNGSSRAMREYKSQAGKMVGAMRAVEQQRQKAMRAQGMTRSQQKRGGAGVSPVPTGSGGGRGKAGGAAVGAAAGQSFMKNIASTAIGMGIANAFAGGVQKLQSVITAPFTKFGSMFAERMNDEMDDIKSAGGMFALDMDLTQESGNARLFNNFNEALRFQEEINTRMAASASNLPGTTSEFVNMNRRMTDTIQMVMENNRENFIKFGEEQGADVSMGGTGAAKEAMAQVGQNLTESLMLASAGQQGGLPMDIAIQQLMNKEQGKIKMQAFTNKFRAAFQKNPLLKNFLMRGEEELNKTAAGSTERLKIITDIFARAIPEDQINKMRGSLNGLLESVRSGLLDPQGGLFGLSRAVSEFDKDGNMIGKLMKRNTNDMGEILYTITDPAGLTGLDGKEMRKGAELTAKELEKLGLSLTSTGQILNEAGKQVGKTSESTTYLFEQLREIGANYGSVLTQFVGLLPAVFDPFAKMTKQLIPMREQSIAFYNTFREFNKNLYDHVDYMKKTNDSAMKGVATNLNKQVMQRSALATLADFLAATGAIETDQATSIVKSMLGKDSMTAEAVKNFDQTAAKAFKDMFDALMGSDLMERFGNIGGTIVGGITRLMLDMIQGVSTMVKGQGGNRLMDGFIAGFKEAFEGMSFNDAKGIITGVITDILSKGLDLIFNNVLPNLLQMYIGGLFQGLFSGSPVTTLFSVMGLYKFGSSILALALSAEKAAYSLATLGMGGKGRVAGRAAVGAQGVLGKGKNMAGAMQKFFFGNKNAKSVKDIFGAAKFGQRATQGGQMAMLGKSIGAGLQSGLKMGAIGGVLKAGAGIAQGKSPLDAISEGLASAGGSAIGGAIGTLIAPGIGTAIGAVIGGFLGDIPAVVNTFKGMIVGLGEAFQPIGAAFSSFGESLGQIVTVISMLIPGGEALTEGFDGIRFGVTAIKLLLVPLTATLDGLAIVVSGVSLGMAKFGHWLSTFAITQGLFTDEQREALKQNVDDVGASFDALRERQDNYYAWDNFTGKATLAAMRLGELNEAYKKQAAEMKKITSSEQAAIDSGAVGANYATTKVEVADQLALLRAGRVQPTSTVAPAASSAPAAPSMEAITGPISELKPPAVETKNAMQELKTELPPAIDTSIKSGVEPAITAMANLETTVSSAAASVVAALSVGQKTEVYATVPLPVKIEGMAALLASKSSAKYMGNVRTAAGGMNLGSAIATEMKNKPAGSDLVIANSAETIIPPGMGVGVSGGGSALTIGDVNVYVTGADNPKEIANVVAEEILDAIQRSSFDELFTN